MHLCWKIFKKKKENGNKFIMSKRRNALVREVGHEKGKCTQEEDILQGKGENTLVRNRRKCTGEKEKIMHLQGRHFVRKERNALMWKRREYIC